MKIFNIENVYRRELEILSYFVIEIIDSRRCCWGMSFCLYDIKDNRILIEYNAYNNGLKYIIYNL